MRSIERRRQTVRYPSRLVDPSDVVRAYGGTVREGVLRRAVGRKRLRLAIAEGDLVRSGWGTYSLPETDRPRVLAKQLRGVLSHRSAARHWGLALPTVAGPGEDVTIGSKAQRRRVPSDVTLRYRDLAAADVAGFVTTPTTTVLDCLGDLDLATALSVGDSALRKGLVTRARLQLAARGLPAQRGARIRRRIALLDERAANALESTCRAVLLAAGITGFEPQVNVRQGSRWIGRADLGHRRLRVLIECEGFEHHGQRAGLRRDCRRHSEYVAAGWLPIRVSWEDVMLDPDWVLTKVRETLALAAA